MYDIKVNLKMVCRNYLPINGLGIRTAPTINKERNIVKA